MSAIRITPSSKSTAFTQLTDAPSSYTGAAGGLVGVNNTGTGLAFKSVGTAAGNIVALDSNARLPQIDGSQLTNIPTTREWTLQPVQSTNFSPVSGYKYPINTSSGPISVTLPPGSGEYWFFDAVGTSSTTGFAVNSFTIAPPAGYTLVNRTTPTTFNVAGIGVIVELVPTGSGTPATNFEFTLGSSLYLSPVGFANPMTSTGDIIVGGTAGTAARVPVGSSGQVLTATPGSLYNLDWTSLSPASLGSIAASSVIGNPSGTSATATTIAIGTSAGNLVQLDSSRRLPAVDGSQLTRINIGYTVNSGPSSLVQLTIDGLLPAVDGSQLQNLSAANIIGTLSTSVLPTSVVRYSSTGVLPVASAANLTSIPAANLTGTLPSGLSLPAAQITGALPALNGSLLTNLSAGNLTGALPAISGAALTNLSAANVVGSITTATLPVAQLSGTVPTTQLPVYKTPATPTNSTATAATGQLVILNGPVSGNATVPTLPALDGSLLSNLSISQFATGNIGTAPNNLVQLTGSGLLPAVSGANLTSLTATNLNGTVPVANLPTGTSANSVVKLDSAAKLPAVDGSQLTGLNASSLSSGTVAVSLIPTGTSAGSIVALDSNRRLPAVDGSQLTNLPQTPFPYGVGTNTGYLVQLVAPVSGGTNPRLPVVDGSQLTNLSLTQFSSNLTAIVPGGLVSLNSNSQIPLTVLPSTGGTGNIVALNSSGYINTSLINVGTGANQIVQLTSLGYLPGLNASLLTNLSAGQLTGALPAISGAALTSINAGSITGTFSGSLSIPAGQLSGALPAISGAALTNINAGNITGTLSSSAYVPVAQITGNIPTSKLSTYSSSNSNAVNTGTLLTLNAPVSGGSQVSLPAVDGSQLTNLNISQFATGNIGTVASQLVQLTAASKLPAVDGSLLSNLNASAITSGTVSTSYLPVGTGASQLVQLTAAGKLPAVDGSLLSNLNASSITGGNLSLSYFPTLPAYSVIGNPNNTSGASTTINIGVAANNLVQLDGLGRLPTVSGANLTSIPNGALVNSSLTFNGVTVSLGGNGTITASSPYALTLGTGLTGVSFNGSSAVTAAIDTAVVTTLTGSQTLTNKTLTSPVISSISNTGTLTLPTSTDTLVGRATTDTLTNKTLTSPVISTIVNGGTLTLPTSTDTLIGRATTDTLSNKTLTSPTINTSVTFGTGVTLPAGNLTGALPAISGASLTGITSSQIGGLGSLATLSTVPLANIASIGSNTLLGNSTAGSASPTALSVGSVQTLLGLGSAAYLSAGTAANNLVQLNGSGQLPAVSGINLTNITNIATWTTATRPASPTVGQTGYNSTLGYLETFTGGTTWVSGGTSGNSGATVASVTSAGTYYPVFTNTTAGSNLTVADINSAFSFNPSTGLLSATGFAGSGFSLTNINGSNISSGTISTSYLPVGTGASQLVQLTAASKLPAVDGSLLTNLPATGVGVTSTSSSGTYYPLFTTSTSGTVTSVSNNTNYSYNPNSGTLTAPLVTATSSISAPAVTATSSVSAPVVTATNGIYTNNSTISTSYTVVSGSNAMSVGPITVGTGQAVSVAAGSRWVVM